MKNYFPRSILFVKIMLLLQSYTSNEVSMNIYTTGTFDLLNVGHLALLEYCKKLNGFLIVGVASDKIANLNNPNVPIIPLEQRIEMLSALRCVDKVEPYFNLDYISTCKELKIDTFVADEDWSDEIHNLELEKYFKKGGRKFIKADYCPHNSSIKIKNDTIAQFYKKTKIPQPVPISKFF
jgi:glycerol-3-phosphate cytidylyltransferase